LRVGRKARIVKGLGETSLSSFVHLEVFALSRMQADYCRFFSYQSSVVGRPAQRLSPIGCKTLRVMRVKCHAWASAINAFLPPAAS